MDTLYWDFRTGGYSRNVIIFPSDEYGEAGYSPEYFASHSEHITIEADDSLYYSDRA